MKTSHYITKALLLMTSLPALGQQSDRSAYYSGVADTRIAFPATGAVKHVNREKPSGLLREFPMARNVKWTTTENSRKAVFTLDGLTTKAFYMPDSTFSYSLTNYTAKQLPEEVLRNIYQTYKKYKIISAKELRLPNKTSFYVILENGSAYKTIKVTDNYIEQVKTLRKSREDQEVD